MTSLSMWSVAGDWCLISPFGCLPAHILCWQHCPGLEKVMHLHSSLSSKAHHHVVPNNPSWYDQPCEGWGMLRSICSITWTSQADVSNYHLLQFHWPTCAALSVNWLEWCFNFTDGDQWTAWEEKLHCRLQVQYHVHKLVSHEDKKSRSSNTEWLIALITGATSVAAVTLVDYTTMIAVKRQYTLCRLCFQFMELTQLHEGSGV